MTYNKAITFDILYIHCLSFFGAFREGILNKPGKRFNAKGYIIDNPKLTRVS